MLTVNCRKVVPEYIVKIIAYGEKKWYGLNASSFPMTIGFCKVNNEITTEVMRDLCKRFGGDEIPMLSDEEAKLLGPPCDDRMDDKIGNYWELYRVTRIQEYDKNSDHD